MPTNSYEIDNQTCRDFKKIVEKNGEKIEEESTACRDEQGNWKVIWKNYFSFDLKSMEERKLKQLM